MAPQRFVDADERTAGKVNTIWIQTGSPMRTVRSVTRGRNTFPCNLVIFVMHTSTFRFGAMRLGLPLPLPPGRYPFGAPHLEDWGREPETKEISDCPSVTFALTLSGRSKRGEIAIWLVVYIYCTIVAIEIPQLLPPLTQPQSVWHRFRNLTVRVLYHARRFTFFTPHPVCSRFGSSRRSRPKSREIEPGCSWIG